MPAAGFTGWGFITTLYDSRDVFPSDFTGTEFIPLENFSKLSSAFIHIIIIFDPENFHMLFKEITGQQTVKKRLIQTVNDSRVSHAQLFFGPEGSGKLALAIAYAQYINCKDRTEEDACGTCPSCVKYHNLAHPDLHFIFPVATTQAVKSKPKSKEFIVHWRDLLIEKGAMINLSDWYNKIGIENKQGIINADDCNEIIKTLSYKSYESEYKVMIIWMVEKLYYSAAPKILKILEEPPEKTLFILVSEDQDQIINTILSRTQLVKVPGLRDKEISHVLVEKFSCTDQEAKDATLLSNGNLIAAFKNFESSDEEKENFKLFVSWMRTCYQFKLIDINGFVSNISKIGREKQKSFLSFAMNMARSSLMMNYKIDELVKLDEQKSEFMKKFSPFINPRNGQSFYDLFNEAYFHIERNANPSVLFMDLSLKAARLLKL